MLDRHNTSEAKSDISIVRPYRRIKAGITSLHEMKIFNDQGVVPVYFDASKSPKPNISIDGYQSDALSIWKTASYEQYITKPNSVVEVITVRFVTSGSMIYRSKSGIANGNPICATLVSFQDLQELQTSESFNSISCTIGIESLMASEAALTGESGFLPSFAFIAETTAPGINALYSTILKLFQAGIHDRSEGDLLSPIVQEILCYQLLSAWPRLVNPAITKPKTTSTHRFKIALDYIEANLHVQLRLADIANAAGINVRSLQGKFRKEIGQTPLEYIINQRLSKVREDLSSDQCIHMSVAEVAKRWGFVHMGDFAQRYRRAFNCKPSEARLRIDHRT